jgi:hypothetical protein
MEIRRLLPLSGIVFVVMVILTVAVIGGDTPESNAPGGEVMSYYDAHQVREAIAAFVFAASMFFLVCFAVTVATALWPAEAGRRPVWEIVFIVGSGLTAAAVLVTAAIHFALTDGATNNASASALQALNLADGNSWLAWNAGLGVMMLGAAGSLIARVGAHRWLGWVALVVGVALFIPFADFIGLLATLIWILVMSVMLFRARLDVASRVPPMTA